MNKMKMKMQSAIKVLIPLEDAKEVIADYQFEILREKFNNYPGSKITFFAGSLQECLKNLAPHDGLDDMAPELVADIYGHIMAEEMMEFIKLELAGSKIPVGAIEVYLESTPGVLWPVKELCKKF